MLLARNSPNGDLVPAAGRQAADGRVAVPDGDLSASSAYFVADAEVLVLTTASSPGQMQAPFRGVHYFSVGRLAGYCGGRDGHSDYKDRDF